MLITTQQFVDYMLDFLAFIFQLVICVYMFSLIFLAWNVLAEMLHTQCENSSLLNNFVIL